MVGAALLAGSAAGVGSAGPGDPAVGKSYGLEFVDTQEAIQRGEGREALRYYAEAARAFERQGQNLEAAKAHSAVAFVALRLGAYQEGIRSGLRALGLLQAEPRVAEARWRQADAYSVVGNTYLAAGDLHEAKHYFQRGLELARGFTDPGARLFRSAQFSHPLGSVAFAQEKHSLAIQHGAEAARALEAFLGRLPPDPRFDHPRLNARRNLAASLVLVANAHRRLGKLTEAETSLRRALEVARLAGVIEVEAGALASLGWVALGRRDASQALAYFQGAIGLATRLNHVSQLIFHYAGIGWSYLGQGRSEDALASFQQAVVLLEDTRAALQETGLRSGFLEDKQEIYHGAVRSALALVKPDEAFRYAERARARAFLDLLGSQTTLSKGKTRALVEEEVRLRAQLAEARVLAQGLQEEGAAPEARQRVQATEQAYRAFLDRVRRENLEQASLMTVDPVTLQEVRGLLPAGVSLLEYLVTPSETIVWVVDAQRVEVLRVSIARRDVVSQVRAFRQAIAGRAPLREIQDRARALYDRLLARARPHLRGHRLLIVPHDVLHYLPFTVLRSPDGRWLIEDYTIATLPSASVLKYLQGKGAAAGAHTLAVGNPDVGPALALRYAEREALLVGQRYPGATVLVREQATEAKAKSVSATAGLLHFATHGELHEQDPLSSALLLVPEEQEDGRLEVREIFGLDLKARLVVLSACETGLGKLSRGDELVGLQRAFLYAGTPAVVTTLWKVDDRASYRLMEHFYANLDAAGPAAALQQAQRATMAEFPHPFGWAAFGLTGVPR